MLGMSGLADPDTFLHLSTATLARYFGSVAADRWRFTGAPSLTGDLNHY